MSHHTKCFLLGTFSLPFFSSSYDDSVAFSSFYFFSFPPTSSGHAIMLSALQNYFFVCRIILFPLALRLIVLLDMRWSVPRRTLSFEFLQVFRLILDSIPLHWYFSLYTLYTLHFCVDNSIKEVFPSLCLVIKHDHHRLINRSQTWLKICSQLYLKIK